LANITPSPLNLIVYLLSATRLLALYVIRRCRKQSSEQKNEKANTDDDGEGIWRKSKKDEKQIISIVSNYRYSLIEKEEKEKNSKVESQVNGVFEKTKVLTIRRIEDREALEAKFKSIENNIKIILNHLEKNSVQENRPKSVIP